MSVYNDLEIIKRAQSGETQLLGILYERHKMSLYGYFFKCTSNRAKSEDLVQNVFLKVMQNIHHFKGSGEFKYWLFRIARNSWIDSYKSKDPMAKAVSFEHEYVEDRAEFGNDELSEKQRRKEKLREALSSLSNDKRDAIVMSRYQGMDYKTIAEISECSESAIKSRIMRGLSELKELVKN